MEKMLEDSSGAALALPLVAEFQAGLIAAKSEVPERAAAVEGAAREAFVTDYRATMVKLLRITCDLEQALLDGRVCRVARRRTGRSASPARA